jgi:succinoglycan biosynthesis transport protein ExoP
MTEVYKFLNFLKQYKLVLIIVPIITVIITFFLVRNLPSSYISQAQISTGITDDTQQRSLIGQTIQSDQAIQQFSNIMEMIKMKRVLDQVSYQLMIHDLTTKKPFKEESDLVKSLNKSARAHAVNVYRQKYESNEELITSIRDEEGLFRVLKSMGYDSESLKGKLEVYRSGASDFITVQFDSENPELSAFVVNTVSSEFIKSYTTLMRTNQVRANDFLRNLLREKTDTLANRMSILRNYKIRNGVLNLTEQSKQLYTLLLEYDTKKQEAIEKTSSYAGALNEIDRKFEPGERRYIESRISKINQSVVKTREELSALYSLYLNNNLDQNYKAKYDSVSNKLTEQINKYSDQYITNPLNTKQELITQKLNLEIQMDISRYSMNSLENKIKSLNSQFSKLVPKEAEVQLLEMNVDIASKEYLEILNKYNQSSLEAGFETKMNVVQKGLPGSPQSSKKLLLIILAGIISVIFCLMTLLLMFMTDSSIVTSRELFKATQSPVLGIVNKLTNQSLNLETLWSKDVIKPDLLEYKNQLRSLRYEIDQVMKRKVLLISSVNPGEGKTLLSLSLACAWKMANRKVLLIDGNFQTPHLSESSTSDIYLEDFLQDKVNMVIDVKAGSINVLKNKGGDSSLMELAAYDEIQSKINTAKGIYDIIIVEIGALNNVTQSREWLSFSEDIIAVFKSGSKLSEHDKSYISLLKDTGSFKGWVLNMVTKERKHQEFFKS